MKLRIRPEARQDLRDIGDDIARDDRRAARRFVRTLRERCAFLAGNPRVGRERSDLGEGLRSFPVRNYVIVYRLLDGVVEIVNVIHGSRDIESLFGGMIHDQATVSRRPCRQPAAAEAPARGA